MPSVDAYFLLLSRASRESSSARATVASFELDQELKLQHCMMWFVV
jgi:hypothetical protein